MVGKPFVISETNHPFPHRSAVEGIPIVTAYAMMHDWDGVFFHEWGEGPLESSDAIPPNSWFRISYNPMKLAQLMVAGLMWHRADVEPAKQLVIRSMTPTQIRDRMRWEPWSHRPFFDDAFPRGLPLLYRTRWKLVDEAEQSDHPAEPDFGNLVADNGQIRWHGADSRRGRVVIETSRVQSLTGFQRDYKNLNYPGAKQLSVNLQNEFASVALVSLDNQPISTSKQMLLFVGDRCTNANMTWRDDFETVAQWGSGPVSINSDAAVLTATAGQKLFVQWFEVEGTPVINDNGSMVRRPVHQ